MPPAPSRTPVLNPQQPLDLSPRQQSRARYLQRNSPSLFHDQKSTPDSSRAPLSPDPPRPRRPYRWRTNARSPHPLPSDYRCPVQPWCEVSAGARLVRARGKPCQVCQEPCQATTTNNPQRKGNLSGEWLAICRGSRNRPSMLPACDSYMSPSSSTLYYSDARASEDCAGHETPNLLVSSRRHRKTTSLKPHSQAASTSAMLPRATTLMQYRIIGFNVYNH